MVVVPQTCTHHFLLVASFVVCQWSACGTEQYWPDRRDVGAVFDSDEYFYIVGGRESGNTNAPEYNDVYRSSFSLNDLGKVATACNINIPYCGTGLSCWPGDPRTLRSDTGVTCDWTRWCEGNSTIPRQPSTAPVRPTTPSSTGGRVKPFNPCRDMDPVPPECDNYEGSTGGSGLAAGGLTNWAIGGIVVLVLAVVGGVLYFCYRRMRGDSQSVEGKLNNQLISSTDSETV